MPCPSACLRRWPGMSNEPTTPPVFRTPTELAAYVGRLEADLRRFAAEVGDFSRPLPADVLERVAALSADCHRMRDGALDLEVAHTVVPDFPPAVP